ncbi:hypothetical protein SRO_0380 [Streptomyces rochei]|nr:hypothetical protein SRO_0380 [Streptomyces rochei]
MVDPHPGAAGDGQDVCDPAGLEQGAQARVLAICLVAGHPGGVQGAAFGVLAPGVLGQVEPAVDQHPSLAGGERGTRPDLGVLDPADGAGVLPLHADLVRVPTGASR